MGLLNRLAPRRPDAEAGVATATLAGDDPVFATKALRKFLTSLTSRESPVLLDLGPVVGGNVNFFGEQLGCKIFVEDIYADIDRHVREGKLEALAEFFKKRFPQADAIVRRRALLGRDGLSRSRVRAGAGGADDAGAAAGRRAARLFRHRVAREPRENRYTKYIIVDEVNLKHRSYPAARGRGTSLLNRDIIRMFSGLRVSDSFLLQNNLREILFRKPVAS